MTTDERVDAPKIRVAARALADAEADARAALPHEIGGIMVGWWDGDVVVRELLPVPDHRAGHTHYERRQSPAQQVLDDYLRTRTEPASGYIGEWHTHPAPQRPSSIDRSALSAIVRQARRPVALVVLALSSSGDVAVHGLVGRPRWPRRVAIATAAVERMET